MHSEPVSIEQSTEFLCPNCGTSAFETIDTQWNADGREFLIMRCFDCLQLFRYRLQGDGTGSSSSGLQEITPLSISQS